MIDLLVVGGGPAGLATALYAAPAGLERRGGRAARRPRRQGLRRGADARRRPRAGRTSSARWTGSPLHGIRYLDGGPRAPRPGSRTDRARGAPYRPARRAGRRPRARGRRPGATGGSARSARTRTRSGPVASGPATSSPPTACTRGIRPRLGLCSGPAVRPARCGLRRHFAVSRRGRTWSRCTGRPAAEAYVTPVAPDLVGVAVLTAEQRPFDEHLRAFPTLAARLGGAAGHAPCAAPVRCGSARGPGRRPGAAGRRRRRLRRRAHRGGHRGVRGDAPGGWSSACCATGRRTTSGRGGRCRRSYRVLTGSLLHARGNRVSDRPWCRRPHAAVAFGKVVDRLAG